MKAYKSTTPDNEKDFAQTPVWLVKSLQIFLSITFELDVCAQQSTAKAPFYFSLEDPEKLHSSSTRIGSDGLLCDWKSHNWCNPPFSNIEPWMAKAVVEAEQGKQTYLIYPDNTETAYSRFAWQHADTIIRMPFRLGFIRPDGSPFLDKKGKKQGPQFPCAVALFTKIGLVAPTRVIYHDFRIGFE